MEEKTIEWIKKESDRLEEMRLDLQKSVSILKQEAQTLRQQQDAFALQKEQFQEEMKQLNCQMDEKKAKLKEEEAFFDKKFKILEMGFASLAADKKTFEAQKRAFEFRRKYEQNQQMDDDSSDFSTLAGQTYFFRGVTHHLALKKRYRDLIKIYHPDNMDGDKNALLQINKEFEQMKKALNYPKKA